MGRWGVVDRRWGRWERRGVADRRWGGGGGGGVGEEGSGR